MNRELTKVWGHWILSVCGVLAVLYCLTVLGFVATAPDLGLRCLLVNDREADGTPSEVGLEIRQVMHEPASNPLEGPQPGDTLIEIARERATTFVHFATRLLDLRSAEYPGGDRFLDKDLLERPDQLPPVVQRGSERLVEVKYLPKGKGGEVRRAWLPVRPRPASWDSRSTTVSSWSFFFARAG
jgi:hypothetical protein